jgi:hypothetical protein
MINRVARVQNAQEYLLKEHHDLLLEVLPEVQEQAVEDAQREGEDGLLIGDTVFKEPIAEGVLDDRDEFLTIKEGSARALHYGEDELQAENFRTHGKSVHHAILAGACPGEGRCGVLVIMNVFQAELADRFEHYQGVCEIPTCFL